MTVFATSAFPSIDYLSLLCRSDFPCIDLGEKYVKQTWRNRYSILTGNGVLPLTIPVIKPNGTKTLSADILVSPEINWRRDHWRALQSAYSSSPYFEHYSAEIEHLLFQKTEKLWEFNETILQAFKNWLELPFSSTYSHQYLENPITDFRDFTFPSNPKTYQQVLFQQSAFVPNLSSLDALFCLGPMARNIILPETLNSK